MSIHVNNHNAPKPELGLKIFNAPLLKGFKIGGVVLSLVLTSGLLIPQYTMSTCWATKIEI